MEYFESVAFLGQRAYREFMATHGAGGAAQQQQQQQAEHARASRAPPPASRRAVRQLPTVVVTPEDLVDPSNRECCICLEEHHLKERVTRLVCAHIFHQRCIVDWLAKSCTCPVCRYELPTDNPVYESTRQERMRHRKPRFALYELQRMSIRELRELGDRLQLHIPIHSIIVEKQDLIQTLVNSGKIHVIAAPEPVEHPLSLLRAMGVGELKRCMANAGVFFDPVDVVEKEDMIHIFVNSGRLVIFPEEETEMCQMSSSTRVPIPEDDGPQRRPTQNGKRKQRSLQMPIVTTVGEDSDDEESDDNMQDGAPRSTSGAHESSLDIDGLPLSHPLMEEIAVVNDANLSSVLRTSTLNATEENSSRRQQDQEIDNQGIDNAAEDGSCNPPIYGQFDDAEEEDVDVELLDVAEDAETVFPRIVGRHASSPTVSPASLEDSQFQDQSIADLQALARELCIDITDCIERSEIIHRLAMASGRDSQLDSTDFLNWSVSELRALAHEVHVDLSNCTDRNDMIDKLMEAASVRPRVSDYLSALTPLARLTVPQLRAVAREWQVNVNDCLEKEEMIHRLVVAGGPAS